MPDRSSFNEQRSLALGVCSTLLFWSCRSGAPLGGGDQGVGEHADTGGDETAAIGLASNGRNAIRPRGRPTAGWSSRRRRRDTGGSGLARVPGRLSQWSATGEGIFRYARWCSASYGVTWAESR